MEKNKSTPQSLQNKSESGITFFLKRVIAGIVVGIGGIVPGVSGGILAVSMGIYKPMLDALAGIFKSFKRSFLFLVPLGIGGAVGLFSMSHLIEWALVNYRIPVMCLFFGLVAGGIPSLVKEANSKGGFKPSYIIATVLGALCIRALTFFEKGFAATGTIMELNFLSAMLCGGILAIGTIIPGISTSFVLMFLGLYEPLISSVNTVTSFSLLYSAIGGQTALWGTWFDALLILLGVAIGLLIVGGLLVLLVKKLIEKYHGYSYYAVLGFLVMSMCLIFPSGFVPGLLLVVGFVLALSIDRYMSSKSNE